MKKLGLATIVAGGLTAAVLGLAAPAQADLGHNIWAHAQNDQSGSASSPVTGSNSGVIGPRVDTSGRH